MNRFVGVAALALVAPVFAARAELVLVGPVTIGGTGLGTVNTVLTIQSQANATTEQGCVIATTGSSFATGNLSGSTCTAGSNTDVLTGTSQTQTRTLSEAGITSASNFAILFNAAEPSGNSISLTNLVAYFRGDNGGTFTATLNCPSPSCNFANTQTGTGNTGYEFVLNSTEAAQLQALIAANGGNLSAVHVGLGAAAGSAGFEATGGNETFFIFNSGVATPVPEPATLGLMATGLFGIGAFARRRRRR